MLCNWGAHNVLGGTNGQDPIFTMQGHVFNGEAHNFRACGKGGYGWNEAEGYRRAPVGGEVNHYVKIWPLHSKSLCKNMARASGGAN